MRYAVPAAIALGALFPATSLAQECKEGFAEVESQIEGAELQAEYAGREATHPLVLRMADGELVDLTGAIVTATPYESWTGSREVVDKVGSLVTEAQPLIEAGNEEECMALLEQARSEIAAYGNGSGDEAGTTEEEEPEPAANEAASEAMEPTEEEASGMSGEQPAPAEESEEAGATAQEPAAEADPAEEPSGEADSPN